MDGGVWTRNLIFDILFTVYTPCQGHGICTYFILKLFCTFANLLINGFNFLIPSTDVSVCSFGFWFLANTISRKFALAFRKFENGKLSEKGSMPFCYLNGGTGY